MSWWSLVLNVIIALPKLIQTINEIRNAIDKHNNSVAVVIEKSNTDKEREDATRNIANKL